MKLPQPRRGELAVDYMRRISDSLSPLLNLRGDNRTVSISREGGAMIARALVSSGTYAFGIVAIDGAKMHIRGGLVQGFNASAWIEETEVSIGGDDNTPHLIIAQGDIGLATCSINAHSVLASTFTGHTDTQWRRALWKVCLRNGTAVALLDMTPGVIDLKSWFGP